MHFIIIPSPKPRIKFNGADYNIMQHLLLINQVTILELRLRNLIKFAS